MCVLALESAHRLLYHRGHPRSSSTATLLVILIVILILAMDYYVPAACCLLKISLEDASQLQRMQDRGQAVVVSLFMDNQLHAPVSSRNLLIDLVGAEKPDEYGQSP